MNKQAKVIIGVLSVIIIILLGIIVNQNNKYNNNSDNQNNQQANNEEVKRLIGIYHNNNWNKNEVSLELKSDMTCKYPQTNRGCKWELKDKAVILKLDAYKIVIDNANDSNAMYWKDTIYSLEVCESMIKESTKDLVNPRCEPTTEDHEAKIINSGLLLHDAIFNKIG